MNKRNKKIFTIVILIGVLTVGFYNTPQVKTNSIDPFFTLVMKVHSIYWQDYANLIRQHIAKIGINLDIIVLDYPTFIGELLFYHDYDLIESFMPPIGLEADLRSVYSEDGVLNIYGYSADSDYNDTYGTGINKWYLQEAAEMLPLYSEEKIQHF